MDKANKQVGAGSSSSSFTNDLFGPKETPKSSSSSSALFNSVFGPPSTGLRRDSVHTGVGGSSTMKNYQYGNAKYGTSGNGSQGSRGDISSKDKSSMYQNEKTEPSYLSSSIYYGGQDVYSPNSQPGSQHILKKDGEDDDQNGNNSNCASRGNWWQGSLYY
ncbi:PREDICTED: uncharacterized protein LOC109211344 [Nicotiana attenuata]|uniref:Uncharacterized protein n=1 Tax=Nicotiana attenuata TaxID=49451 RepID=A0A314KJ99_NICAT|nr:PREDICTED: uncharacterized protein LOC109211344 [Nicotiana attenuata]OIT29446.1 hypothetical protein A4A49_21321 [Nicotiana attenuata]